MKGSGIGPRIIFSKGSPNRFVSSPNTFPCASLMAMDSRNCFRTGSPSGKLCGRLPIFTSTVPSTPAPDFAASTSIRGIHSACRLRFFNKVPGMTTPRNQCRPIARVMAPRFEVELPVEGSIWQSWQMVP